MISPTHISDIFIDLDKALQNNIVSPEHTVRISDACAEEILESIDWGEENY